MSWIACLTLSAALAGDAPEVLDTDTTWSEVESPILVATEVVVEEGSTLHIEPGVEVRLSAEARIVVQGGLVARGTAEDPIRFVGDEGARWGSIVFEDTAIDATYEAIDDYAGGSILEHCELDGGSRMLQLLGASPHIQATTFRDGWLDPEGTEGGGALYITDGSTARVVDSLFEDNAVGGYGQGGAVFALWSDPIFQGNVFRGNESVYGAAVTLEGVSSPVVGNLFEANVSGWEGGAISLVSTPLAFLDNRVVDNEAVVDGGGVHVCVTCYPHSVPFFHDNVITGNTNLVHGAAGLGGAYLRGMSDNDVYDNLMDGYPADFAWHNRALDEYPAWVHSPSIAHNWWGTTDECDVAETIFDGEDEDGLGVVDPLPLRQSAIGEPSPRVTFTTRKLHYESDGEDMPLLLTLYNPGEEREFELALVLVADGAPPAFHPGLIDVPGAERDGDLIRLTLPAGVAWYGVVQTSTYDETTPVAHVALHAALFDAATGERLGDVSTAPFDLGSEDSR